MTRDVSLIDPLVGPPMPMMWRSTMDRDREYLTPLGISGKGIASNSTPYDAMRLIHDLLLRATNERLDVFMLAGMLREKVRDSLYKDCTNGVPFAQSLREVLEAGMNVNILVWNQKQPGVISPEIKSLIKEPSTDRGTLDIRIGGTLEFAEKIPHFLVAKSRDNGVWYVRVEQPHPQRTVNAEITADGPAIPAALLFREAAAQYEGSKLLKVFDRLFTAAGKRARQIA